ncbi:hypothetical protein KSD_48770 [Ktedonobacter sp. SOSP1-85]|nr:hypothetical protein KSD_48770 [Ktedonobacter sp. SOSP1-85]
MQTFALRVTDLYLSERARYPSYSYNRPGDNRLQAGTQTRETNEKEGMPNSGHTLFLVGQMDVYA